VKAGEGADAPFCHSRKNAMVVIMGDRSDLIFIALMIVVMMLFDSVALSLLVACVHRTLRSNEAIRRELYPPSERSLERLRAART
jgi:hypothetical protein